MTKITERDESSSLLAVDKALIEQAMEVRNSIGLMKNEDERNNYGNHAAAIKVLEAFLASSPPPEVPMLSDEEIDSIQQAWIARLMNGSRSFAREIEQVVRQKAGCDVRP